MESEKVEEIKKALEELTQHKPANCYNGEYVEACGMYCKFYKQFVSDMGSKNGQACKNCSDFIATDNVREYADILTLINELESENDTLHTNLCEYRKENKKLKDRIAELEKENAKLLDSVETVQNNRCVYKCVLTKENLKQFATLLKVKTVLTPSGWCVNIEDIDETLKEFIND